MRQHNIEILYKGHRENTNKHNTGPTPPTLSDVYANCNCRDKDKYPVDNNGLTKKRYV